MKITFSDGNDVPGKRLVAAFTVPENGINALLAEVQHFEDNVTVYKLPQYDGTSYPLSPADKGLHPIVLAPAKAKIAEAGRLLSEAHFMIAVAALNHGITEPHDGGGGK